MARKDVSASVVREWAATEAGSKALTDAGAPFPGKRGRMSKDTLAVFHKKNKNMRYTEASDAEKPSVTVSFKALDKIGRPTTRKVTLTTREAREILGQIGPDGKARRGRLRKDDLALALEARALADATA